MKEPDGPLKMFLPLVSSGKIEIKPYPKHLLEKLRNCEPENGSILEPLWRVVLTLSEQAETEVDAYLRYFRLMEELTATDKRYGYFIRTRFPDSRLLSRFLTAAEIRNRSLGGDKELAAYIIFQ